MTGATLQTEPQIGQRVKVLEPFRPVRYGRIIGMEQEMLPIFSQFQVEIDAKVSRPEDPGVQSQQEHNVTWVAARHCCVIDADKPTAGAIEQN